MSSFVKDTTPLLEDQRQSEKGMSMTVIMASSAPDKATTSNASIAPKNRLISLDQFRGSVILCLIIVPLLGGLKAAPDVFKHKKNFFSLADAIMPQFYVAVGFAMQLTLRRLRAEKGIRAVFLKQLRRSGTLYLISLVFYGVDDQKTWALLCDNWPKLFLLPIWNRRLFQSLNIIGVTQLIIVPVITRPVWVRVCFMFASMAIYIVSQWTFYMKIQWKGAIDGGAFGAFSWAFVMLAGSILTDWNEWILKIPASNIIARRRRVIRGSVGLLVVAGACWLFGYLISSIPASWSPMCYKSNGEPTECLNMSMPSIPFVPPKIDVVSIWTMSQATVSFSLQLATIGYALLIYFFWFIVSDIYNYQFSFLNTLSTHSLLIYLLDEYGLRVASSVVPNDAPLFMLPVLVLIGLGINILIILYIKANNINLYL